MYIFNINKTYLWSSILHYIIAIFKYLSLKQRDTTTLYLGGKSELQDTTRCANSDVY